MSAARPQPDGAVFAQTPELWAAVRQYAAPAARVVNNPLFLAGPDAVAGEYVAGRCWRTAARALPAANWRWRLAPLPDQTREAINDAVHPRFCRRGHAQDTADIAKKYGCDVVVVVPQDKAWATIRSLRAPITAWRTIATANGGSTRGDQDRSDAYRYDTAQIPANQLKPCLLQNVSRKSFETSIALTHLAFL